MLNAFYELQQWGQQLHTQLPISVYVQSFIVLMKLKHA